MMAKFKLEDGTEVEAFTAEEMEAKLNETTSGLKAKVDELLGETKTAKQRAKELEDARAAAEQEALKKSGEFQKLWETEAEKVARIQRELEEERDSRRKERQVVQQKEVEGAAMTLAAELTRDTKRAELLRKEIGQFARYTDDGVKFEMGGVEVDRAKVLAHITDNYPFLVDGSGATGGGATGANKGGGAATIGKPDGDKHERAAYFAKKFGIQ